MAQGKEALSLKPDHLVGASTVVRREEVLPIVVPFVAEAVSSFRRVEWLPSDTLKGYLRKTVVTKMHIANKANGTSGVYRDWTTTTEAQTAVKHTLPSASLMHLLEYFKSFLMLRGDVQDNLQISSVCQLVWIWPTYLTPGMDWSTIIVGMSQCNRL